MLLMGASIVCVPRTFDEHTFGALFAPGVSCGYPERACVGMRHKQELDLFDELRLGSLDLRESNGGCGRVSGVVPGEGAGGERAERRCSCKVSESLRHLELSPFVGSRPGGRTAHRR
jgi:hypothetical protein